MRSGVCTLQQTLTAEAASILKHSLVLARRRGHAQVTPLHVAATLLSLRASSPFKRACLKSQPQFQTSSHPLHCKALELCFNVALNRLPTTQGPSFLQNQPSLSNALIAALKRAQAHHRRGENQKKQHFLGSYTNSHEYSTPLMFPITHEEDMKVVLDILLGKNKKKNSVIVGDSLSLNEGLVDEIMRKFERREVPNELKTTNFIKFQFSSLSFMNKDEVKMNLSSLKKKVDSVISSGRGAIFYVGDLKWIVEGISYESVDVVVEEIGKLFSELRDSNTSKVCVMGTASYQTYMRCQMRQPPLETHWNLQVVPVPSGGLGLTLHAPSVYDSKMTNSHNPSQILETKLFSIKEEHDKLNCCEECDSNYEKEAVLFKPSHKKLLPSWLQSHSTEVHHKDEITQLKRKWNGLGHCLHQRKQPQSHWSNSLYENHSSNAKIYPYNSSYPWWPSQTSVFTDSSSISFADSAAARPAYSSNLVPHFKHQQSCTIEFSFINDVTDEKKEETTMLDSVKGIVEDKEVKVTLALGNSTYSDGSREKVESISDNTRLVQQAHICKMLQENVPWHSEKVSSISEALVLGCSKSAMQKSATWLFMHGNDYVGKTRLARAIAESFFGSVNDDKFLHLDMMIKTCDDLGTETQFSEILNGALKTHEQLVILIENVDSADAHFKKFLADEFETLKLGNLCNNEENSCNAIFILSNDGCTKRTYNEKHNKDFVMKLVLQVSETKSSLEPSSSPCLSHKRNLSQLDFFTKIKKARIEEKEQEGVLVCETKKEFSTQSSFNTLDLNIKAHDNEEEEEEDYEKSSSNSSDSTREIIADNLNSNGFVNSIKNRFELNQSPSRERKMKDMFLFKIKGSFEEVYGVMNFSVENKVIEEIGVSCGSFTNSMFEKWLKDIFQTSLRIVNFGGKEKENEGIVFTLCWGGKGDKKCHSGFMSSCLPKNIQVNYFMD
ncbi:hypothetical protein TanjilG_16166 [Lupinus angustifolius]|uniref:Clp R domain-containing protein n=1 Tax=Lupinus angustifolius TaxID=3871 RepID=A0A1J7GAM1_LUPAN|nr:hypothetical protein TanjilG_16166 [Lupinus angustifolius]